MERQSPGLAESLSGRERELVVLASQGLTDTAIAQSLGIGLPTIATYWNRVRLKFNATSRTEVVAMFLQEKSASALDGLMTENRLLLDELGVRAQAEAMLKSTLDLVRGLVETAPDGIVLVGESGEILLCNRQADQMFGYESQEMLGMPVEDLVPPRLRAAHGAHRIAYGANPVKKKMGEHLATYALKKDKTEFPIAVVLSGVVTQAGLIVTCLMRDLTDTIGAFAHQNEGTVADNGDSSGAESPN